jgi:Rrf2 family protein
MLCLSKKIDYALVALAYLAEREREGVASAREIAQANELPLPLLMKILKRLHRHGVVSGTRGVKGGYRLARDTDSLSLHDLIVIVEDGDPIHRRHRHGPVQALQYRLVRFLRDVKLSDLVIPGRRIDVPLERILHNEPKLVTSF